MRLIIPLLIALQFSALAQNAQELYKNKEYLKALDILEHDYAGFADIEKQLLWARCAVALGDDEAAMSAYERVINLDEKNVDASLYLAAIYKKQNQKKESDALIEKLKSYTLSAKNSNALSALLEDDRERGRLRINANAKIGYDSNINANAGSGNLDEYYQDIGSNAHSSEDVIDSLFGAYGVNLSYLYDLGEESGFYLQSDINLYAQNFKDASEYDIYFAKLAAGVGYKMDKSTLYLPISYDHLYYLESNLLNTLSITPTLNTLLSKNYLSSLRFIYKDRTYIDESFKNRDDVETGVEVSLFRVFEKSYLYSTLLADFFKAKSESDIKYINKDLYALTLGGNYHIGDEYFCKVNYQFRSLLFSDTIETESSLRKDSYHNASVEFSKIFLDSFEANVNYSYIINSSNYLPSSYSKNIISAAINYNY